MNEAKTLNISCNRVRELRIGRLMTQKELAKRSRVSLRTIYSIEKGKRCQMNTKRKILKALGLGIENKNEVFLQ